MKTTLKVAGWAIAIVLVVDFWGFAAWVISGQHPVDDFYVGTITAHVLGAIVNK